MTVNTFDPGVMGRGCAVGWSAASQLDIRSVLVDKTTAESARRGGRSAPVNDDVVVTRLAATRILVGVGAVGGEGEGVAGAEVELLVAHVHAQQARQHHDELGGAGAVGLGGVHGAAGQAQLVDLDV